MNCYNCGSTVSVEDLYCNFCGSLLKATGDLINRAMARDQEAITMLYNLSRVAVYNTIYK